MNEVFTYYEPIADKPPGTMALWRLSWRQFGWNPIVLGEEQFFEHPSAVFYDAATNLLPTFNHRIYERACYRRWMAMSVIGGGLMTDYDVVNRGFTPQHFADLRLDRLTILCEHLVPCVVWGNCQQYFDACLKFAEYKPTDKDVYVSNPGDLNQANHGKPLVEDMTILRRVSDMHTLARTTPDWFVSQPICCDVRDLRANPAGYASTPLIHCSAYGCHGRDRVATMASFTET